jgi:hypothetical protein
MKNIIFIFIILSSCGIQSQEKLLTEKREVTKLIEQLNFLYPKKDKELNTLFSNVVQCTVCEIENGYENEYLIKKEIFIKNNLAEVMKFFDLKKIKNSINSLQKTDTNFILSYQIAKPDKKTGFEGASVLITFKRENGKLKIYSIETIP